MPDNVGHYKASHNLLRCIYLFKQFVGLLITLLDAFA